MQNHPQSRLAKGPRPVARAVALLALVALLVPSLAAQSYVPADLDPSGQWDLVAPFGMNHTGRVVGAATPPGGTMQMPVLFESGTSVMLPLLPGHDGGVAVAASDGDVIVGASTDVVTLGHITFIVNTAAVWNAGTVAELASLVTSGDALDLNTATGISADGAICGIGFDPAAQATRGFVTTGGELKSIGALGSSPSNKSHAQGINDRHVVVGASDTDAGGEHAVRFENGVLTDLHATAGIAGGNSRAFDVNRFGVISGAADFTNDGFDLQTAALWIGSQVIDLGHLGHPESWAFGLNDLGTVVGGAVLSDGQNRAFLWNGGSMIDLNTLVAPGSGWILLTAGDIDNAGRITGTGSHQGVLRAFLALPDCAGGYSVYAAGCPGGSGFAPVLGGHSCPTPGASFAVSIAGGHPGALGALLAGSGTGSELLFPGCSLEIAPRLPLLQPFALDPAGASFVLASLPPGTPAFIVNLQAVSRDPNAAPRVAVSNALRIDFR